MRSLPLLLLCCSPLAAQDWPQWRGPLGDNVSTETAWSNGGQVLWRAQVGTGYTSPAIVGSRLVLTGYLASEEDPKQGIDRVSCLDTETGEELWRDEYPTEAFDNEHAGGALSAATLHEGKVYVPTRGGEVRAYELESGQLLWEVDLVQRHEVSPGRYGFASSPYIIGDALVLCASRAVCLELATGETRWISEAYDANFSTVRPITLGERRCLVVFGGEGVCVVDEADGSHVAKQTFRKHPRNVEGSTPVVMGTRVFVSTAYEQGGLLVDFAGEEPEVVWRTRAMRNKMAGCTLWEDHLYGFDESMLKCIDLEGNEVWRQRGLGQGAMTIAGGRLITTTSRGALVIAAASPEGYQELARHEVATGGGVFWAPPVLAGGRIYVRGSYGELVCTDHRTAEGLAATPQAEPGEHPSGPRPEVPEVWHWSSTTGKWTKGSDPDADQGEQPRARPTPEELVAGHLATCRLGKDTALRMEGRLFVKALGLDDVAATWEFDTQGRWHGRMGMPAGWPGHVDRYFDGELAWEQMPFRRAKRIEDPDLAELVRTAGGRDLLEPIPAAHMKGAKLVGLQELPIGPCWRVDVPLSKELTRSVFFVRATGLYAGRSSAGESTLHLSDWREVDGKLLPFLRTVFENESGQEQRWVFSEAAFEGPDPEGFVVPKRFEGDE